MDEQTKILMELNSRMGVIENTTKHINEKLDGLAESTKKIDEVEVIANKAMSCAEENEKDINEIKENQRWTWRTIAGIGVSVVVYFITRFFG